MPLILFLGKELATMLTNNPDLPFHLGFELLTRLAIGFLPGVVSPTILANRHSFFPSLLSGGTTSEGTSEHLRRREGNFFFSVYIRYIEKQVKGGATG